MKSKAILSALCAVGAVLALGTGPAMAQAQTVVKPDVSPTYLKETGSGQTTFQTNGFTHSCLQVSAASEKLTGSTFSAIAVTPTFSCEGTKDVWHMNGCIWVTTPTSLSNGSFSLGCPAGKEVEITNTTYKCTVYIPAQAPPNQTVILASEVQNGKKQISVQRRLGRGGIGEGITYRSTGGACGEGGTNGVLVQNGIVRGYRSAEYIAANQQNIVIVEVP